MLLGSGLHVPFSLGIYGLASNASLDWGHTIQLTGIRAFDEFGNQLSADRFAVSFSSGLQVPSTSVPEPGGLGLLAAGCAVHAWRRRRPTKSRPIEACRGNSAGRRTPIGGRASAIALVLAAASPTGCSKTLETPVSPAAVAEGAARAASPADRCVNVSADGSASLAFPVVLPDGTFGFGADWFATTIGGISGEMASVVTDEQASGSQQQGARHLTLEHAFRTASGDYFLTQDRAVCAPSDNNPATCRLNDVLTIVSGTGIFANANGSLRNHGTIDFASGTLQVSLRGRVCGDGL